MSSIREKGPTLKTVGDNKQGWFSFFVSKEEWAYYEVTLETQILIKRIEESREILTF